MLHITDLQFVLNRMLRRTLQGSQRAAGCERDQCQCDHCAARC